VSAVKVNGLTSRRPKRPKTMLEAIDGIRCQIVKKTERAREGEMGLAELTALAELIPVLTDTIDAVALHLLRYDEASYREIAIALGITRTAAVKRYRGNSTRPVGGREARLR
jgi:hypothetical protein